MNSIVDLIPVIFVGLPFDHIPMESGRIDGKMIRTGIGIHFGPTLYSIIARNLFIAQQREHEKHRIPGHAPVFRSMIDEYLAKRVLAIQIVAGNDVGADLPAKESHRDRAFFAKYRCRSSGAIVPGEVILHAGIFVSFPSHHPDFAYLLPKQLKARLF